MNIHKTYKWGALACVTMLAGALCAWADEPAKERADQKKPDTLILEVTEPIQIEEKAKAELTGSAIQRKIRRVGRITNGPVPVVVIDQSEIQRSGARTLADVLRMDPAIRIRGR